MGGIPKGKGGWPVAANPTYSMQSLKPATTTLALRSAGTTKSIYEIAEIFPMESLKIHQTPQKPFSLEGN
jgi:hypothetical protein